MTHKNLVDIGYKWCLSRCGFAIKELTTFNMEIPDVIGFNSNGTFVLEIKISRSDFLADQKKHFRKHSDKGMGDWRFYLCPEGLISINELPAMWGLIEVNKKKKTKVVFNPFGKGNIYHSWLRNTKCNLSEKRVLYSVIRRLQNRGLVDEIYTKN